MVLNKNEKYKNKLKTKPERKKKFGEELKIKSSHSCDFRLLVFFEYIKISFTTFYFSTFRCREIFYLYYFFRKKLSRS